MPNNGNGNGNGCLSFLGIVFIILYVSGKITFN
jgi:hypothetical protein